MNWIIGIWIKIQLWWNKLLGKTEVDDKVVEAVKEIEERVKNITKEVKVKKPIKKKRGRKPKNK